MSDNDIQVKNISTMARGRSMTNVKVVAYLEGKGNQVVSWEEFEAIMTDLKRSVLNDL